MSLSDRLETLSRSVRNFLRNPSESVRILAGPPPKFVLASDMARQWGTATNSQMHESGATVDQEVSPNPLQAYFDGINEGPGVWNSNSITGTYTSSLAVKSLL